MDGPIDDVSRIKKAYFKKALKNHPDRIRGSGGSEKEVPFHIFGSLEVVND